MALARVQASQLHPCSCILSTLRPAPACCRLWKPKYAKLFPCGQIRNRHTKGLGTRPDPGSPQVLSRPRPFPNFSHLGPHFRRKTNPIAPFPLSGGPCRLLIPHSAHSKRLPPPGMATPSPTLSDPSSLTSGTIHPLKPGAGYFLVYQSSRGPPRKEQGNRGPSDTDMSKCEDGQATAPSPGELGPCLWLL